MVKQHAFDLGVPMPNTPAPLEAEAPRAARRGGQKVVTYGLPGLADSRRTTATPSVASVRRCPSCGTDARLPRADRSAICSRCEIADSPEAARASAVTAEALFSVAAQAAAQAEVIRKFGKWA